MYDNMGNLVYRPCPIRIYNSEEGSSTFYSYGANQITGWRRKQEDRYVCIPKFHEDLSLFGVYDGHGGERVVQYLERYLHQCIRSELKIRDDPELALYFGYMGCDTSMRSITREELDVIKEDLNKEFELNESHDRRKVIREFAGRHPTDSAKANKNEPNPDEGSYTSNPGEDYSTSKPADSSSKPNTGSIFNQMPDAMKDEIMDKVIEELPHVANSIFYLTKAPLAKENDDSDDDTFEPDDDEMKAKIFDESSDNGSEESTENESDEEPVENEQAEQTGNDEDQNGKNPETGNNSGCLEMETSDELLDNKESTAEQNAANNEPDFNEQRIKVKSAKRNLKPKIGQTCGSTATVLLLNKEKLHLANVGDSRCVACINGQAVDLSVDHKPNNQEEKIRILDGGGSISKDGRVNDILDMSRAFGDFEMKLENVEAPFQVISAEPYVTTIDVTPDLEFIVVASDGIWNTMDSCDVIHYVRRRLKEQMEVRDIIGELFEEIIAPEVTEDGSGCDNLTAIIIKLSNECSNKDITSRDIYSYMSELLEKESTEQGMLQIQQSLQMAKPSDLCQPHEESDDYNNMLEPILSTFNEASVSSNENYQGIQDSNKRIVRNNQNFVGFLNQLYFAVAAVNTKLEDVKKDIALINNKCNSLSEIITNIKAALETELPLCNDVNYFSDKNAFLSTTSGLAAIDEQNSYNAQNVAPSTSYSHVSEIPSTSFSSTPIYISEDASDTSHIYPNTTSSLDIHPSTSHTHQLLINADAPGTSVPPDQIPRVSLSRREKRLLYASNPQDTHEVIDLTEGERDSSTNRVASEPEHNIVQGARAESDFSETVNRVTSEPEHNIVEVANRAEESDFSEIINRVTSEPEHNGQGALRTEESDSTDNKVASEPEHNVQGAKRAAEETEEVSKKLKTDDYAISNTEKHK